MNTYITASSAHTHMGTPPPDYHQDWETHTVHVHGFPNLPSERGEFVFSPKFMLSGNEWGLEIYSGGNARAAKGMVSLYLGNMSNKAIEVEFGFSVNDGNGKQVAHQQSDGPRNLDPLQGVNNIRGFDLAERSTLLNDMVNGTLVIEIHMRLATPTPPIFIPENLTAKNIQRMITD